MASVNSGQVPVAACDVFSASAIPASRMGNAFFRARLRVETNCADSLCEARSDLACQDVKSFSTGRKRHATVEFHR